MGAKIDSSAGKGSPVVPTMNVTPLVDVVLVLLIIFMVVTPLLMKQFWLNLPKKSDTRLENPPPDENDKNLVVTVNKEGVIKVNSNAIPKDEFANRLGRMIAARSDKTVYFDAEDQAPYALAVEVLDLARRGGAATIAIMTDKVKAER
jgi:biopolymer transport protein ExbD/biopolymer transport protein TolR